METAVFGGGCFWCTEAVFRPLAGVASVEPGYAGGHVANPTYEQVCTGATGHAEVTRVEYDPATVDYRDLLTVFFGSHDPTQPDGQGNDIGTQYRSVVFFTTAAQEAEAESYIRELAASSSTGARIITALEPLHDYYPAEDYHQEYFKKHPEAAYCQLVIEPKLQKVQKEYAALLKREGAQ